MDTESALPAIVRYRRGLLAGCVALGVAVAATAFVLNDRKGPQRQVASPVSPSAHATPRASVKPKPHGPRMTPTEVVTDPRAVVTAVGVAPGDPDVRLAIWQAGCPQCQTPAQRGEFGPPTFEAMAITQDGYRTATYVRLPKTDGPVSISSPRDDVFLLHETNSDHEWLIDRDGTVRPVRRVQAQIRPADPRLWFRCPVLPTLRSTWCALDVDTARAHPWRAAWNSANPPTPGAAAWGVAEPDAVADQDKGGRPEAFWERGGIRHRRTLANQVAGDAVAGVPAGEMAFWARRPGSNAIALHISHNGGARWEVQTRSAPHFSYVTQVVRSPDGAFLTWNGDRGGVTVWRAEASGGPFRRTYATESNGDMQMWAESGVVHLRTSELAAWSTDGGRTWTALRTWR